MFLSKDQIEAYTKAAQQLVAKLPDDELGLLIPLLSKSQNRLLLAKPSKEFKIIYEQLLNDPIEKQQAGVMTYADLLRTELRIEAQKRKLIQWVIPKEP